ncbi:SMP-30/gluconolactonase/LRE family protein [Maribacter sp. 2304DJ31-5]|uniref:SMP-30/gluconolactonase/LRE family protein n=1 Tax=Maribacter sp. 2304DJ31-5 TaxID=3386273 RepID=UPI0039BC792F
MKKALSLLATSILLIPIGCSQKKKRDITKGFSIEILDKEAQGIINQNTKIEILGEGFDWTEGPLWIEEGHYLLFSDIPKNKIYKIDTKGNTSEYLSPSGYTGEMSRGGESGSNGLLLNKKGQLVLLQHGDRRVALMESPLDIPAPRFKTLIDNYMGDRFNSPNDGVYDFNGNLYFTDPPYGLPKQVKDPSKELDFQGVYCLKNDGEILLLDSLTRPNGITLSPDQTQLYVAVSDNQHAVWYQYDIVVPGKVANKRVFHDATKLVGKAGYRGLPDGMKMHSKGYLFATGPGGVWIFNKNAKPIARIRTGQATSNCAFSQDEKQLFMTADDYILKIALETP